LVVSSWSGYAVDPVRPREGEQTAFDVIKGDLKLVEGRDVAAKAEEGRMPAI
jgi:hypothetical protein